MGRWLDLAERLEGGEDRRANSANSANSCPDQGVGGANGTNGANGTGALPPSVRDGLRRLVAMPAPRMKNPEVWPGVVRDCCNLARDGWAGRALALGWKPGELWGVARPRSTDQDGLAVWLNGRRVLLLDADSCIVDNGPGSRSVYNRRPGDAALIWNLGKGRGDEG